jgi:hypothetical protein
MGGCPFRFGCCGYAGTEAKADPYGMTTKDNGEKADDKKGNGKK